MNSDSADNYGPYVTTNKASNFQGDIPSIRIQKFKYLFAPVFDFNSKPDAAEKFQYAEVGLEPLKLDLKFTFLLKHGTDLNVLGS